MATPVSTGQLLVQQAAQNRERAREAQVASPAERLRTGASNALGLINQGIGNITSSLTAGQRREAEQADLDRANAIRLEAQDYTRGQAAQQRADMLDQREYQRGQNVLANQRADARLALSQAAEARTARNQAAQLAQQATRFRREQDRLDRADARQAALNNAKIGQLEETAAADTQYETELANAGLSNFENTPLYTEYQTFAKNKAEQGSSFNPVLDYFETLPKELQTADAYDNLQNDVNSYVKSVKESIEGDAGKGAWNDQYQELAVQKALQRVGVESSNLIGTGEGEITSGNAFKDILHQEMAKLKDFEAKRSVYEPIAKRRTNRIKKANLNAQRAALQNY